jgi:hypothetical protein
MPEKGVKNVESRHPVHETIDAVERSLQSKAMKIFARLEDGKVYLSFNSSDYLVERHQLAGEPFKPVEGLLARAIQ